MTTETPPETIVLPRQRTDECAIAEPERDQMRPGDVDRHGRVLAITRADDMGVWLTAEEASIWMH